MKHIRLFESNLDDDVALKIFLDKYEREKTRMNPDYKHSIYKAQLYEVPKVFYDEFTLLDYYYSNKSYSMNTKKTDEYIKKEVKKIALKSIMKKFEEDFNNYNELKKVVDKKFKNIGAAAVKYIFFLFDAAIKKAPDWMVDSNKYNL